MLRLLIATAAIYLFDLASYRSPSRPVMCSLERPTLVRYSSLLVYLLLSLSLSLPSARLCTYSQASGGIAGAGSLIFVYPLDYARTRLASDVGSGKRDFKGLGDCLVKTARGPSGFLGLYNGFGVSVMGIIPYRGVYFGLYDSLREKNPWKRDFGIMGVVSKFAVAQATAIAAGYASYPFDTVRRRLQMQSEKPKEEWVYRGTADCFKKILRDEGMVAMFKGAGANAVRTVGSALVLVLYDQFQIMLAK